MRQTDIVLHHERSILHRCRRPDIRGGPILSACHTVHGVGEDLSAAGKAISHTAEKASGNKWRQRPDTRNRNGPMSCISLPMSPSAVDASALGRRAAAISMMLP
jgi:hypothetical protein